MYVWSKITKKIIHIEAGKVKNSVFCTIISGYTREQSVDIGHNVRKNPVLFTPNFYIASIKLKFLRKKGAVERVRRSFVRDL